MKDWHKYRQNVKHTPKGYHIGDVVIHPHCLLKQLVKHQIIGIDLTKEIHVKEAIVENLVCLICGELLIKENSRYRKHTHVL